MTATLTAPAPTPVKKTTRPKQNREAIFLFLPALLPVLLLSVYPLLRGISLGFTDARAGLNVDTNFIGFANFAELLHNDAVLGLVPDRPGLGGRRSRSCSSSPRSASPCCSTTTCGSAGSPGRSR